MMILESAAEWGVIRPWLQLNDPDFPSGQGTIDTHSLMQGTLIVESKRGRESNQNKTDRRLASDLKHFSYGMLISFAAPKEDR